MNSLKKLMAYGAMSLSITGCFGLFSDPHQNFVDYMNSQIGDRIESSRKVLENCVKKDQCEIVIYHGERAFKFKSPYANWAFSKGKACGAVQFISVETMTKLGWDYAPGSDPKKCVLEEGTHA